jgi:dienelactone hydrolase
MFKSFLITTFVAANLVSQAFAWNSEPSDVSFNNTDGLTIQGKIFVPTTTAVTPRPAVIMLHGCAGIYNKDGDISNIYREWADRLVNAGYVALLVDSFTPRNAPNQCNNGAGVGVSEIFDRPKDVDAAYAYLSTQTAGVNPNKIGVLGWSHGGSTVVSSLATTQAINPNIASANASTKPIKVGIAFYAGCGLADYRCGTQSNGKPASCWGGLSMSKWDSYAPLHFFHGTADTTTKLEYCNTRINLATTITGGGTLTMSAYDGAVHSFDDPNVGGGVCVDSSSTPNACAKQQADTAALSTLNQYLK